MGKMIDLSKEPTVLTPAAHRTWFVCRRQAQEATKLHCKLLSWPTGDHLEGVSDSFLLAQCWQWGLITNTGCRWDRTEQGKH